MQGIITSLELINQKKLEVSSLKGENVDNLVQREIEASIGNCKVFITGYSSDKEGVKFYTSILTPKRVEGNNIAKRFMSPDYEINHNFDGTYVAISSNGDISLYLNRKDSAIDNSNTVIIENTKWKKIAVLLGIFLVISAGVNCNLLKYKKLQQEVDVTFDTINRALDDANKYITKDGVLKDK